MDEKKLHADKKPDEPTPPRPPADDSDTLEHLWARMSARLGIVSMGLCMAAPCTCTASYWAALPAAIVTLWLARNAFVGSDDGSATRAYSKVGLWTGGTALFFSLAFFLMMASWTVMWMGLIVLDEL
jgi:hypothetical protein